MNLDWQKAEKILKDGGIVVLPTDTLYGLITSVFSEKAVEKIYKIKERNKDKPFIVLISSIKDLEEFGIKGNFSKIFIPKVSVLVSCKNTKFKYIHRGTGEIAFRLISKRNKNLYDLINKVGPIVAPSANRESEKPAETISEAKKYFGDKVDYYINGGMKIGEPSTLIRVKEGKIEILRQGTVRINKK
jgi:L-threonylcarbamoyladenylate synthase